MPHWAWGAVAALGITALIAIGARWLWTRFTWSDDDRDW